MKNIFFESWESLVRTAVIGILAYVLLVFLLRTSGKRTLSKMNAFDLIITIALGSTLATVVLNKSVTLADGALAFFLLIYLQYLITFLSVRSKSIRNLVKSTPTLIAYKGSLLKEAMVKERISEDEVHAIIREKGVSSLAETDAIIMETDGSLTLIKSIQYPESATLTSLQNWQK
jgi:uncharacterized membrane protein YcaP (DUF421 family)